MMITTSPFVDVEARASELGCNVPEGIAILPRNFASAETREELLHEDSTVTVRTLWRTGGITESRLELEGERYPYIHENAADWVGPLLFIGTNVLISSPETAQKAVEIILDYVKEQLGMNKENRVVKFDIVRESKSKKTGAEEYTKFTY